MIKKKYLSKEDKKIWEDYITNPTDIFDKDRNNFLKNKKIRFKFDLHGFSLDKANKKVKEVILFCIEKNYKEILFITGKGKHSTNEKDVYVSKNLGRLRFSVPEYLNSNQELNKYIISINEAEIDDGGQGALLVKLRNL